MSDEEALAQLDREIDEFASKYFSEALANSDDSAPANPEPWDPWLGPVEPKEKISTED